jgi:hypothetical protein
MLMTDIASPDILAPELTSSPQFLTSLIETPWDDFLFTSGISNSPALFDSTEGMFDGSLFGDMVSFDYDLSNVTPAQVQPLDSLYPFLPETSN